MNYDSKTENCEYVLVPKEEGVKEPVKKYGLGVRHLEVFLGFLCLLTSYTIRGHLGVTIVAMTDIPKIGYINDTEKTLKIGNISEIIEEDNKTKRIEISLLNHNESTVAEVITNLVTANDNNKYSFWDVNRVYDWPKSTQEMVLGSFFLGYFLMMMPMGLVVQKFGGKLPLQIAMVINGIVTALTPWITAWGGWRATCASRILIGLSQACIFPSLQTIIAKWTPMCERGQLSSYVYTGSIVGTVIGFQVAGILGSSKWGWPSTLYALGFFALAVFAMITVFMTDTPAQHSRISEEEKAYIMGSETNNVVTKIRKTPWKAIFTSKPVLGSFVTHCGSGTAFAFVLTQVPTYLHHILGVDIRRSGILSSLPYIASMCSSVAFGLFSDFCINHKFISVKNTRRAYNTLAQIAMAMSLAVVSYTGNLTLAVASLVFGIACHAAVHIGWMINYIDLAPVYSPTLMAIGNTLCNFCNLGLPLLISQIVTNMSNQTQWRIVFCVVGAGAVLSNLVFVVFLSVDVQPWNFHEYDIPETEDGKKEKEKIENENETL